jgi:hypothetical protein
MDQRIVERNVAKRRGRVWRDAVTKGLLKGLLQGGGVDPKERC